LLQACTRDRRFAIRNRTKLKMRNYFLPSLILLALLSFSGIIFNNNSKARTRAAIAESRVEELEEQRLELEGQLLESYQYYDVLRDSLDNVHDSLEEVRESAKNDALTSSRSFNDNLTILRDSLANESGLESLLDTLELNHQKEVSAYQVQVAVLEEEKLLLYKRVEVLDSMWTLEQQVNASLRLEVTALNEQSDAWKSVANPGVFRKAGGAIPYILAGVAIGSLIQN